MATRAYSGLPLPLKRKKSLTVEELYLIPKKPFYELYDGVLQIREYSGSESSNIAVELATFLFLHVREQRLGKIFGADHRCVISRNPDTVLIPDVSFIRHARIVYGSAWGKFFEGSPDLVVEVMSPSDRLSALQRKTERYLAAGTSLVWIIQPRHRKALICRKDGTMSIITNEGILDGEDVIPGFTFPLASLFT